MLYCPCLGEWSDGLCDECGAPATTEVQCGWHNGRDGEPSGGQYQPLCGKCYAKTEEAVAHLRQTRIREAADRLGISPAHGIVLDGYGAHPRAEEIRLEMEGV